MPGWRGGQRNDRAAELPAGQVAGRADVAVGPDPPVGTGRPEAGELRHRRRGRRERGGRRGGRRADRVGHPLADLGQAVVEPPAGAARVADVTVAGDVGERALRPVGGGERRRPLGIDVVAGGLPGQQPHEGVDRRRRRLVPARVVAEHRHPGRAGVHRLGVGADDAPPGLVLSGGRLAGAVAAGEAALVDPALLVDEEVVADVVPAVAPGVVGVDRPDGLGRVGVVVLRHRVVHHELRDRGELGLPLAHPLVGPPPRPGDDLGLRRCRPVSHRFRRRRAGPGVDGDDLEVGGTDEPADTETGGSQRWPDQAGSDKADIGVAGVVPD